MENCEVKEELMERIAELVKELKYEKYLSKTLMEKTMRTTNEFERFREQYRALDKQKIDLESESRERIKDLSQQLLETEHTLEEKKIQTKALAEENVKRAVDVETSRHSIQQLKEETARKSEALNNYRVWSTTLEKDLKIKEEELKRLKEETARKSEALNNYRVWSTTLEKDLKIKEEELKRFNRKSSKGRDEMNAQTQKQETEIKGLQSKLTNLGKELENSREQCAELNDRARLTNSTIANKDREIAKLQRTCDSQQHAKEHLGKEVAYFKKQCSNLTDVNHALDQEKQSLLLRVEAEVKTYKSRADELENKCQQLEETYTHAFSNWESNVTELQNDIKRHTQDTNHYKKRCSELEKEKTKLYEDKQSLLKRVYSVPNLKLGKDMSDIADLSDSNRPSKVAEEYSELYDKDWTDAFESLHLDSNRNKVQLLEKVLQRSYQLCKQTTTEHLQSIQDNLQTLDVKVTCTESGSTESDTDSGQVGGRVEKTTATYKHCDIKLDSAVGRGNRDDKNVVTKSIKYDHGQLSPEHVDALLAAGHFIQKELQGEVADVMTTSIVAELNLMKVNEDVLQYVRKCVVTCWAMCQYTPPIHIDFVEVRGDIAMDTNVYKPYTKTGRLLDYVVWPPLYLHEHGPMLGKGVAQAK